MSSVSRHSAARPAAPTQAREAVPTGRSDAPAPARTTDASTPFDATLARAVRLRASETTLARFWIKENAAYRWEPDERRKVAYIETSETRGSWFPWPWASPVYIPARDIFQESSELMLGYEEDEVAGFNSALFADLDRVVASAIGRRLLSKLSAARHWVTLEPSPRPLVTGPITEAPMRHGYDPTDPRRGAAPSVRVEPGVSVDALVMVQQASDEDPPEATWNPTPSHVALFHELVHAYHYVYGTKIAGRLTDEQAIHPGDVGVAMSEYQATGLNTADGERTTRFALADFTENAYRAELGLIRRDTYIPTGYRVPTAAPPLVFA